MQGEGIPARGDVLSVGGRILVATDTPNNGRDATKLSTLTIMAVTCKSSRDPGFIHRSPQAYTIVVPRRWSMTPELWVTLVVGLGASIGKVLVAWMDRGRRSRPPTREPKSTSSEE